jgi:hypothetical protein
LERANLRGASGLTAEMIRSAFVDGGTVLDFDRGAAGHDRLAP